jgi:hypothetical protein
MGKTSAAAAIALALALLGGCVHRPEIPFEKTANNIKTIGILTPGVPSGASVILASSVGRSFGIIGALVDAGMTASRDAQFDDELKRQSFKFEDAVTKSLSDRLTAAGYTVSAVPLTRKPSDFVKPYPKSDDTKVDAYLDVYYGGYGYIAAGIGSSTPYRPGLSLRVRLVNARDASVLMEDTIIYTPIGTPADTVTISPDPDDVFLDFDALKADPDHAAKGLYRAIDHTSDTVVKLLQ